MTKLYIEGVAELSEFPKNQAEVTGEVSREPRLHSFGEGREVLNIPVQVRDERNRMVYMTIVCFDDLAKKAKDAKLNTRIYAKGSVQKGKDWIGRDGEKMFGGIEIIADEIAILGTRSSKTEKVEF